MTILLDIPPDVEARLKAVAARDGIGASEYVRRLIEQNLPTIAPAEAADSAGSSTNPNQGTLDLLAKWAVEDSMADPESVENGRRDFEELKHGLNRNRVESGGPNARKVFP